MGKAVGDPLTGALKHLEKKQQLKLFKAKLTEVPLREGSACIPRKLLQEADAPDLSDLLLRYYPRGDALQVAAQVLEGIHQGPQAQKLRAAAGIGPSNPKENSGKDRTFWFSWILKLFRPFQRRHHNPERSSWGARSRCLTETKETARAKKELSSWRRRKTETAGVAPVPGRADQEGMQATLSVEPHFIDQHQEQLIRRTAAVEGIWDRLYGGVLNGEEYRRISSRETNPDKMRELYRLVPSWNRFCKDRLYEALRETNPFLIADLEGR